MKKKLDQARIQFEFFNQVELVINTILSGKHKSLTMAEAEDSLELQGALEEV